MHSRAGRRPISIFIVLLLLSALLPAGCGGAPAPQTLASQQRLAIRLATDYREDSIGYQQLQDFARLVQEKSDNTIVVKVYSSGQWSQQQSFLEYLQLGNLEMACLGAEAAAALQPALAVYQQPYLFTSLQHINSYIQGEEGQQALALLPARYHGLGFVPDGYTYLTEQQGEVQWLSYSLLKQQGQTRRLAETRVYDLQAVYSLQPLVAMTDWWNGLGEQQQQWIDQSFQEALHASFAQQEDKAPVQTLLANGVTFVAPTDPSWESHRQQCLSQRETYFTEHIDTITAYWRPVSVTPPQEEEETAQ